MLDVKREVRRRLASLNLTPAREAEIVEEISQHLDDRQRELIAGGATPDEAIRLALGEFSSENILAKEMASLRQAHARSSITPGAPAERLLAEPLRNFRYAARVLWRQPWFTAIAIITLALGIGGTTAIFSVVYGVLLKPLPFDEADRLVDVNHLAPGLGVGGPVFQGPAIYFTYRDNSRVFEDVGLSTVGRVSLIRDGAPEQVQVLRVTDGLLSLLRVRPELGRLIQKEDDVPDAPLRVLLTYGCWQRTFGGEKKCRRPFAGDRHKALRDHWRASGVVQVPEHRS